MECKPAVANGATDAESSGSENKSAASTIPPLLLSHLQSMLAAAQGSTGYEELQTQISMRQLERALHAQRMRSESLAAHERLAYQLSHALHSLQDHCAEQQKQLEASHAEAATLQAKVGQKRKQIEDLKAESMSKHRKISALQQRLHIYESLTDGICSYVAHHAQQLKESPCTSECLSSSDTSGREHEPSVRQGSQSGTTEEGSEQISSQVDGLHEGVAGLLAMHSTADSKGLAQLSRSLGQQSSEDTDERMPRRANSDDPNFRLPADYKGGPVPKRASCQIFARHPQAPHSIRVICKQLKGKLLLDRTSCHLQIKPDLPGCPLMTPAEFEAAAGCSKGKNWKANIKVQGNNGRNQMLKVWLPGLIQLVGDHVKTAVQINTDIYQLLDRHSSLRIQTEEQ